MKWHSVSSVLSLYMMNPQSVQFFDYYYIHSMDTSEFIVRWIIHRFSLRDNALLRISFFIVWLVNVCCRNKGHGYSRDSLHFKIYAQWMMHLFKWLLFKTKRSKLSLFCLHSIGLHVQNNNHKFLFWKWDQMMSR